MEVARKVHYDACDMQNGELTWSCAVGEGGSGGSGVSCGSSSSSGGNGRISPDLDCTVLGSSPQLQPRKLFDAEDCDDDDEPVNNNKRILPFVAGK